MISIVVPTKNRHEFIGRLLRYLHTQEFGGSVFVGDSSDDEKGSLVLNKRLVDKLSDRLKARGVKGITTEGKDQGNWVVVDTGDIIVHLFRPEVREFYNIEKMWSSTFSGATKNGIHAGSHPG